jgi:NADPH:quinone reductase-like Zn-dependent oxidoreductase
MKAHGDFEQLDYLKDFPTPKPKENEVLIEVKAAGVNNTDINTRIGWYAKDESISEDASWDGKSFAFPRIQGADVCGYIVSVGKNVDAARIGERVIIEPCIDEVNGEKLDTPWYFGSECDGGFAQYTKVSSKHAYKIESEYSDTELASFPCSYSTAENLLTKSNVKENETVLISGASGGVGSAAIQLARARGANVIAITSASKLEKIKELGASKVISRDENIIDTLGKKSVDVVIDLVGGSSWANFLEVLKPKGRYAVSGAIAGAFVNLDLRTLYLKDLSFFGCTVLEPQVFANLLKRIENKDIKPLVSKVFPLASIVEAQKEFLRKKHIGKIVLKID